MRAVVCPKAGLVKVEASRHPRLPGTHFPFFCSERNAVVNVPCYLASIGKMVTQLTTYSTCRPHCLNKKCFTPFYVYLCRQELDCPNNP